MDIKRRNLAPGTLEAPIPPAMVTVGDFEKSNVLTIAWTGILATQPPRTYVSVRPSRHSYGMLKEGGEFVINLPSVSLVREVDFVGIYTGAKMDKFERCGLTKVESQHVSPPTIAECPVALECRVCEVLPMGTHDVFIADIVGISCHDSLFDEDGKLHFERADLLAYAHGEYYTLGEVIGRFGFSTDKPKKNAKKPSSTKKTEEKPSSAKKTVEKLISPKKSIKTPDKKPFYESAPRKALAKRKPTDKNKGAPHGKRTVKK